MTYCGQWSAYKHETHGTRYVSLPCRSWGCPHCCDKRRRQLQALAHSGKPTRFMTLTIKASVPGTPVEHAHMLADAFKKLMKRWRRLHDGAEVEYLAVFEATKNGQPHIHVMLRSPYTSNGWISNQMRDLLDSPITDIRAVREKTKVVRYIAKYLTKSNVRFGTCKRYWCSRGYSLNKPEPKGDGPWDRENWWIAKRSLDVMADDFAKDGFPVDWVSDHEFILGLRPGGTAARAPPAAAPATGQQSGARKWTLIADGRCP